MAKPNITLVNQTGKTPSGLSVDHGQWIVFADGVQVGYLPKSQGAWLQCIVTMDDESKDELLDAISEHLGSSVGGVAMPPEFDDDEETEDE